MTPSELNIKVCSTCGSKIRTGTCDTDHYNTLRERKDWLGARIEAKKSVNWDVAYDTREKKALEWALEELDGLGFAGYSG